MLTGQDRASIVIMVEVGWVFGQRSPCCISSSPTVEEAFMVMKSRDGPFRRGPICMDDASKLLLLLLLLLLVALQHASRPTLRP
ncbi:hypothetical protein CC78DRAFT_348362 [Lojkania enalia]|uniref:Uncharacterized protein n=1 Tax=Lojkania enalia TaxID=147567 RepID=A0A9P4MXM0_9PLEO|nr:hypothetical protein CC78DRAFT_348362 [Didymosphaeria enalia]